MTQLALLPSARPKGGDVSDQVIGGLVDEQAALKLSMDVSGLTDQQIADQLEIEYAQFSRIKAGTAHFPQRKVLRFMDVVGNEIYLRFLVMRRGYGIHRLLSEIERENEDLKRRLAERDHDLEVIQRFLRGASFGAPFKAVS